MWQSWVSRDIKTGEESSRSQEQLQPVSSCVCFFLVNHIFHVCIKRRSLLVAFLTEKTLPDRDGFRTRSEGRPGAVLHVVAGLHDLSGGPRLHVSEGLHGPKRRLYGVYPSHQAGELGASLFSLCCISSFMSRLHAMTLTVWLWVDKWIVEEHFQI